MHNVSNLSLVHTLLVQNQNVLISNLESTQER